MSGVEKPLPPASAARVAGLGGAHSAGAGVRGVSIEDGPPLATPPSRWDSLPAGVRRLYWQLGILSNACERVQSAIYEDHDRESLEVEADFLAIAFGAVADSLEGLK